MREWMIEIGAAVRSLPLAGGSYRCACCGWAIRRFTAGGYSVQAKRDGYCPRCNSKPRHRWLWSHLPASLSGAQAQHTSVLHIAPAHSTFRAFSKLSLGSYVTVGLDASPRLDIRMDLSWCAVRSTFDVVVCVHVLEHVDDDVAAINTLRELTSDDGVLLVGVPVLVDEPTREDPAIVTPKDREQRFGEPDHRRWYGLDIVERLERVGFDVESHITNELSLEAASISGLKPGEGLFICTVRDGAP